MKLEQALFGYKGGHRRLASSGPFQPGDEKFLVRMTDLSGSRMATGFEEYLSGYMLPSRTAYAFTKTWYAPECERPGCVWSHAIFVGPNDWDRLEPELLCSLFRRPESGKLDLEYYSTALGTNLAPRDFLLSMPFDSDCATLVDAIYSDSLPVICSAETGVEFENLLVHLTWQRPLWLRNTFSFCSGALSFLRGEHDPLRVQVMPARAMKATREEARKLISGVAPNDFLTWVRLLVEDLWEKNAVLRFALESHQDLSAFTEAEAVEWMRKASMACVSYRQFEFDDISTNEVLDEFAAEFPLQDDQVFLKRKVLERATRTPNGRSDLVRFMLSDSKRRGSYSGFTRVITEAAVVLSHENPAAALKLLGEHLFKPRTGDFADDILQEILASLDVQRLHEYRPIDSQILYALAQQQQKAILDPAFWLLQHSFEESAELADTLTERLGEDAVLAALLSAGRFDLLLRILRLQGAGGAYKAFRLARKLRLADREDHQKLTALKGELNDYTQTVIIETRKSAIPCDSAQLFLLSSLNIEPGTLASLVPDVETWLEAVRLLPGSLERIHAVVFFLACSDEFPEDWRHMAKSFDLLHQAAANKTLPYEWWWLVKPKLPSLAIWEKWDKCERLRRGLVDAFFRNRWSVEKLRFCTNDEELYQKLRDTYQRRTH